MKSKSDITVNRLIDAGWKIDHYALYNGYCASGSVSDMRNRKGNQYCRIHIGKCKFVKTYNYPNDFTMCLQETIVMRKPL